MKIDCVLTATNDNYEYHEFIPLFIKCWSSFLPNADVKIIFVGDCVPQEYSKYKDNIILFKPIENVSTAFTAQFIRLLYPCLFNYKEGVLLTDMDMLPMNSSYYTDPIKNFTNDCFISYRDYVTEVNIKMLPICYNVASPSVWKELFFINSEQDIIERIKKESSSISYSGKPGEEAWFRDQIVLTNSIQSWDKFNTNFIILDDTKTGYKRLDRSFLLREKILISDGFFVSFNNLNKDFGLEISQNKYSDYHCLRPYKNFKHITDMFVRLATKK
jgi:hypothetical protein